MDPIEQIQSAWRAGHSVREIARMLGKSKGFVRNRLAKLGLSSNNQRPQSGFGVCKGCSCRMPKKSSRHYLCDVCVPDLAAKRTWRVWKLTRPQVIAMLKSQGGCCLLCQRQLFIVSDKREQLAVIDHDHANNRIRGLLCTKCNLILGAVEFTMSNPMWLRRSQEYLRGSH